MTLKIFLIASFVLTFELCLPATLSLARRAGLLISAAGSARATDMSSENYHIQSTDFNMASGSKESANFKLSDVVGSVSSAEFNSKGYILKTGFSYLTGNAPFTFSIGSTKIDFGDLTSNIPKVISTNMVVQNGLSSGYQLLVAEKGPLQTAGLAVITDTRCDNPNDPCTAQTAGTWTKPSTFGFGFGMVGKTISSDFKDTSYFRPFADLSKGQLPTLVMASKRPKSSDQATINFKINISSSQPVGRYQNTISFLALPGY